MTPTSTTTWLDFEQRLQLIRDRLQTDDPEQSKTLLRDLRLLAELTSCGMTPAEHEQVTGALTDVLTTYLDRSAAQYLADRKTKECSPSQDVAFLEERE